MQRCKRILNIAAGITAIAFFVCTAAFVQEPKTGKLKLTVSPAQAYAFVDQRAIGPGSQTIKLSPGKHNVIVANYGYDFLRQDVDIESDKTTPLDAHLQMKGDPVGPPRGRIQFEVGLWKAGDYAVLLNGKTPYYMVGHIDEFNNEIGNKQELVVPPGQYLVTVTRMDRIAWSGTVDVSENQRVIVDISNGKQVVKDWTKRSQELGSEARFRAGSATTSVNVAPVSGNITATPARINCSQQSLVAWTTKETIDNDISNMSPVEPSGQETVSPKQTTTYELTGTGPGGVVKTAATLEVNPVVTGNLQVTTNEVKYRQIGDKVITQGSDTLDWSTENADSVSITPLGSVPLDGTRTVPTTPTRKTEGPVDETFNYMLTATNVCGGSLTRNASVHLTGSIEPIPVVLLNSIFFPTDYPEKRYPSIGLVSSQQSALDAAVNTFNKYLEYDPDAKLSILGNADTRGGTKYNQALSERRVDIIKNYLVEKGVAPEKIDTTANGDALQVGKQSVVELQTTNPAPPPESHRRDKHASWLAYNRRVDIVLMPKNQESSQYYPNAAPDMPLLWQRPKPSRKLVEQNQPPQDQPAQTPDANTPVL
jgi:hypothetical protein